MSLAVLARRGYRILSTTEQLYGYTLRRPFLNKYNRLDQQAKVEVGDTLLDMIRLLRDRHVQTPAPDALLLMDFHCNPEYAR